MIVEPIMMNAGIIEPEPGFLAGLKDLLHSHGALLTFDEVKTGLTAGYSGATGLTGVTPDIICLAKADRRRPGHRRGRRLGRGHGARRGQRLRDGRHLQRQPARGGRLPRHARPRWPPPRRTSGSTRCGERAVSGIEREIARTGLQAHVVAVGAKGCVVFSPEPVRNYRGFLGIDDRYSHAHWLFQHNGGVFLPPWGKIEQWLISVQHDESDIDRLVANFGAFAAAVSS